MGKRKGTTRRKSRRVMTKDYRNKGKISVTAFLAEYKIGDKVIIKPEPAYQKGICHLRFYGQKGVVVAKRGMSYIVEICDIHKKKKLIVHPVHLKRLK
jgi:large subunit ribosomal protein L21e